MEMTYMNVYDATGHVVSNVPVSNCCTVETEHQNCSSYKCECPCHEMHSGMVTASMMTAIAGVK